ncbi:transcriptional regulatory protein C2H10.01 [Stagonosporopsis vannaccii]|nr:transcriptional regulatory protein C2H10.01 [Stagonosporopsis vannaccii]
MSALSYAGTHRYPRSNSARTFPETYYNERHVANEHPRIDPYAYPVGGPVNKLRHRAYEDQNEFQPEQGGSRRRIAVACARCRKRKIRCTGDGGDGEGCQNCKMAGVDASQCIFHRVGSDQVHKVMDSYNLVHGLANMASGHNMMPVFSTVADGPYYRGLLDEPVTQPEVRFGYSQLDDRPVYESGWTAAYGGGPSPVAECSFDQSQLYLPRRTTTSSSNVCELSCHCVSQSARHSQSTTNYCSDYGHAYISNGLPYPKTDVPPPAAAEPFSPLNMSSLQLTLPERPRQRQTQPTEVPLTPRRRLPAPTPRPGHGLHHAIDHQQDQRLRSSQTIGTPSINDETPSYTNAGSFAKPLLPWAAANENLVNAINEAGSATMSPQATASHVSATAANNLPDPYTTGTSANHASMSTKTPSQDLQFDTFSFLDPSLMTAPNPPAYSNFRESRDPSASSKTTQLPRTSSSPILYTYGSGSRRTSLLENCSSSTLIRSRRYTPLNGQTGLSNAEEPIGSHNTALLRASDSNVNSTY